MQHAHDDRRTILLVEDDLDVRDALARVLRDEGYCVRAAGNGLQALEALRCSPDVQLILLDLMMPVMDGWAFRAAQRADPGIACIPVIVLSAHVGTVERDGKLQPAAFLRKPVQLGALLETVAEYASARTS